MGRVLTGRGDVFNYKRGEMTRGMETVKPYDYGKLMTQIGQGVQITDAALKSPLGASGSPLVTLPKAAYGLAKQGVRAASDKMGFTQPDPMSEAARVKALAEGKVLPKPPAAAPVPGAQGGAVVAPPTTTARESGRPLIQRSDPAAAPAADLPDRIAELLKLQSEQPTPELKASYQSEIDRLQTEYRANVARVTQPQPAPVAPAAPAAPVAPAPSMQQPGMTAAQAAGIGPETQALFGAEDKRRQVALALQQGAYQDMMDTQMRGTSVDKAQAQNLTGMDLLRNRAFNAELRAVAQRLGMDVQALANVMFVESGMSASIKNPGSTASGLIQIMDAQAQAIDTSAEALRQMNPVDQLKYVEDYFARQKGLFPKLDFTNADHVDLAVFGPAYAGKSTDAVMYATGTEAYDKNRIVDVPGSTDGGITVQERLDFAARQAKAKGGPVPTLTPVGDLPPKPELALLGAQQLVEQRKLVDAGTLVVPGVRPSNPNLNNLVLAARNVKSDADRNWIRTVALEDSTQIPWTSLGDLFTGSYKQRALKQIEAAFPKEPKVTPAQQAGIDLKKSQARYYDRMPKKSTPRSSRTNVPDLWKRPFKVIEGNIASRSKRRAALEKSLDLLVRSGGDVNSKEFSKPRKDQMESQDEFDERKLAWTEARAIAGQYRNDLPRMEEAINEQLDNIEFEIAEYENALEEGAALQSKPKHYAVPPGSWTNKWRRISGRMRSGSSPVSIPKKRNTKRKSTTGSVKAGGVSIPKRKSKP